MGGSLASSTSVFSKAAEAARIEAEKKSDQFEQPDNSPTAGGGTDPTGGGKGSSQQEQPVGPREESFRNPWAQSRPQFMANRRPNSNMFGQGRFSGGSRSAPQAMAGMNRQNPGGGFTPPPPMQAARPNAPPPYTPPSQQPSGGKGGNASAPAPAPTPPTKPAPPSGVGLGFKNIQNSIGDMVRYEQEMEAYNQAVSKQGSGGSFNPGTAADLARRAQGTGGGIKPGQGQ